jgi:5-methylcytosine-specific restriction endonuclease McrA
MKHIGFKNIVCETGEIAVDYAAYLLSNHWRRLRDRIYELRKHTCERCKKKISLYQVHHKSYKHIGYERDGELMLVCYECHEILHKKKDAKRARQAKKKQKAINDVLEEKKKKPIYCGKYYDQKQARKISPVTVIQL